MVLMPSECSSGQVVIQEDLDISPASGDIDTPHMRYMTDHLLLSPPAGSQEG